MYLFVCVQIMHSQVMAAHTAGLVNDQRGVCAVADEDCQQAQQYQTTAGNERDFEREFAHNKNASDNDKCETGNYFSLITLNKMSNKAHNSIGFVYIFQSFIIFLIERGIKNAQNAFV